MAFHDPGYRELDFIAAEKPNGLPLETHSFAAWNIGQRPETRNCYAFAADALYPVVSDLFAPGARGRIHLPGPGTTGGKPFRFVSLDNLREGLLADGFLPVAVRNWKDIAIPPRHYLIACYYSMHDFHFYRFSENENLWACKPSCEAPVTFFDQSGRLMRDVGKADRGAFACLAGFFLSPPGRRAHDIVVENSDGEIVWRGAKRVTPRLRAFETLAFA